VPTIVSVWTSSVPAGVTVSAPWNSQNSHASSSVLPSMPGAPPPVIEFSHWVISPKFVPSLKFSDPESTFVTTLPATCLNDRVGTVAGVPFALCLAAQVLVGRH